MDHLGSTRAVAYGGGNIGWLQDYEPYGKVLGGTAETRKGYIDKERDREGGTHNHGVRQYVPEEGGRFLSVDALWEKYRGWSPYVYSQNNPVSLVDGNGMEVDFTLIIYERKENGGLKLRDVNYTSRIIADLERLTGLDLEINMKTLRLEVVGGSLDKGSYTARALLLRAISSDEVIKLSASQSNPSEVIPFTKNNINLNPTEIGHFIHHTYGLDKATMGFGLTFFHEYMHTQVGGQYKDPRRTDPPGSIGFADVMTNAIRREMGPEFGQRTTYNPYTVPGSTAYVYYPFTIMTQTAINNGALPSAGYVSVSK